MFFSPTWWIKRLTHNVLLHFASVIYCSKYKPCWELLSCILQHLFSNHLFQGTIGDPGIQLQHIFIEIETSVLQTLENRAKACSNLHIVNRDSAFTTTPSMCLESWRIKQNYLNPDYHDIRKICLDKHRLCTSQSLLTVPNVEEIPRKSRQNAHIVRVEKMS